MNGERREQTRGRWAQSATEKVGQNKGALIAVMWAGGRHSLVLGETGPAGHLSSTENAEDVRGESEIQE